jgi:hypothetical protein
MESMKKNFKVVKEFDAVFEKNVLVSLDGETPVKAVENITGLCEKNENDLKSNLNNGNFQVQNPYILLFFNKITSGLLSVGIGSYFPFNLFPFFVDVSSYSNEVFLSHEPVFLNSSDYISGLYILNKIEDFVFFGIDVGAISAFGNKIIYYKDEVNKKVNNNYFGIISASPSIYLPRFYKSRKYISEQKKDIYYTAMGSNVFLSI